jgi:hypothetical protein
MPPDNTLNQEALQQAHVDIAVMKRDIENLRDAQAELRGIITKMFDKLDQMNETLVSAKGGWRFMMALGGAGATFGAGFVWLVQAIGGKHP